MKLEGKVAAITAATTGIGRGIAERFLEEGATVAIMARSTEKGEKALEELDAGENCIFVSGDAILQSDVEGFIDQVVKQLGTLDILVNNAGGASDLCSFAELPDDTFDTIIKWNLYSNFWATRRALKTLIAKKYGRIINISSMEGKRGKAFFTPYTAAKHAINGMTKSLAQELGPLGITVNSICPGLVITDAVLNTVPETAQRTGTSFDAMIKMFTDETAIKRPNTVEEVAALAVLLASAEGGGITGTNISVDGGTAQF